MENCYVLSFGVALTPPHWCLGNRIGHTCTYDLLVNSDVLDHNGLSNQVQFGSLATVVTLYNDFLLNLRSFHFIRKLFYPKFLLQKYFYIFKNFQILFLILKKILFYQWCFLSSVSSTETWLDLSRRYLGIIISLSVG